MVRRVVTATGWHMTGKEKPACGGLDLVESVADVVPGMGLTSRGSF